MVLANDSPIRYRNGIIRLKIRVVLLRVGTINDTRNINIIDLREEDILIGYN